MWDTSIVFHQGKYYLFSMYESGADTENTRRLGYSDNNMWCAVSDDGVVWRDIGPVIKDQPFRVYKMFVSRLGNRYVMNHGSFSGRPGHGNDTLHFWESEDLVSWRFLGFERESHPDARWYDIRGRWDHMYMLPDENNGGYLGYCVATTNEHYPYNSCGLLHSADGYHWDVLPPPVIDWTDMPHFPMFEVGGCERENGKYFLIGGLGKYAGNHAYGVYTLVSDYWNGPFRPDVEAYRLCGSSGYPGIDGVQWLASFGRGKDDEFLITNYLTDGIRSDSQRWGGRGHVWFLPVKKAIIDDNGHLRMGYWKQNDLLKGDIISASLENATLLYPAVGHEACEEHVTIEGARITVDAGGPDSQGATSAYGRIDDYAVVVLNEHMDLEKGIVVEGTLQIDAYRKIRPTAAGFYFEESSDSGTYLLLEAGDPRWRRSDIGVVTWGPTIEKDVRDVTQYGCATVTGIEDKKNHAFRILYRKNMFEVYIDDLLVQTFITSKPPTGRVGFIVQNARCVYSNVHIWQMIL